MKVNRMLIKENEEKRFVNILYLNSSFKVIAIRKKFFLVTDGGLQPPT